MIPIHNSNSPLKHLIHQHPMNLLVAIHAQVPQDRHTVIQVHCVADGRQDRAAGHQSCDDDVVDIGAAENHVEFRAKECRDTALFDDHFVRRGCQHRGDLSCVIAFLEESTFCYLFSGSIERAALGVAGSESSDDVDDFDILVSSR